MFARILSHKNAFRCVGNSAGEVYDTPLLKTYVNSISNLRVGCDSVIKPRCEHRLSFALFLTELLEKFIFEHEFVHYLNGHVLYIKEKYPDSGIPKEITWTLEKDADTLAAQRLSSGLIGINKCEQRGFYSDVYDLFGYYIFALSTYFIAESVNENLNLKGSIFDRVHPTASLRIVNIQVSIIGYLKLRHPEIDIEKMNMMMGAMTHSFYVYNFMCENKLSIYREQEEMSERRNVLTEDESALAGVQCDTWFEIRDELQQYAYVNLAPKVSQDLTLSDGGDHQL